MDIQYIKAEIITRDVKLALQKIYENADCEDLENSEISNSLYKLIKELKETECNIKYFSKPTRQGDLIKNSNGKYEIEYTNGDNSYSLTSGMALEIYISGEWHSGKVEHTATKGYYFKNTDNKDIQLYSGMKTRIRICLELLYSFEVY